MIDGAIYQHLSIDLPPLMAALFASLACAILGNFLVLRRTSLMGDAIAHAVLPGIVLGFLFTHSRATLPIFIGAALAGILTVILVEGIKRLGKIEAGASMGVVFSIMFALGVLLMEQASARSVDLDADCLLYGQIETIFWYPPKHWGDFFSLDTLFLLPNEVVVTAITLAFIIVFVFVLFKELTISSFDPLLSTSLGFSASLLNYLLMIALALAVVASFKVVGSILVIAMIICPAAIARLLTDRLDTQIFISVIATVFSVLLGYFVGASGVPFLGINGSINIAGSIVTILGLTVATSVIFAPRYGILGKKTREIKLSIDIIGEDILGYIFKNGEDTEQYSLTKSKVRTLVKGGFLSLVSEKILKIKGLVEQINDTLTLTPLGISSAKEIVRAHRLWEGYLVDTAGVKPDHVHDRAMELEHFTSESMAQELAKQQNEPNVDPHGKKIP